MTSGAPRHSELSDEGLKALGARNACDREPIHLSGAVQPLGFLLAVDPISLVVSVASSNVGRLLGDAGEPLGRTVGDLLGPDISREVLAMRPTGNPHDGLPLRVQVPDSGVRAGGYYYYLVAHQREPLLILEFEECPSAGSAEAGVYLRVRDAMKSLDTVDDVDQVCQVAAHDLRSLTGYDRVMVYRFDPDANGEVIAESCRDDWQPYLGLRYPASDIPRQARALYLRSWIRVIADVDYSPVPLIALPDATQVDQLDLSMSVLRSVSPTHLQYLRNMGVHATMTISLVVDNQLWGMVACHHGTPKRVDAVQRLACETFGQLVSVRIKAVESSQGHERART
jgi:chemotaxis family two-component system sensor kinase Cph1